MNQKQSGNITELWCEVYEIIHIWTAVVDESKEWSSQWIFQFKLLERRSLKKIRASTNWIVLLIVRGCGKIHVTFDYHYWFDFLIEA